MTNLFAEIDYRRLAKMKKIMLEMETARNYWKGIADKLDNYNDSIETENSVLEDKLEKVEAEYAKLKDLYNELLYAVARKHQGESRHATALRYIRQAEQCCGDEKAGEG